MKKFLSLALVFCLAFTAFLFVGCSNANTNIKLDGGPKANELVTGNGSFQVRKGDYVYFASGYIGTSDLGTGGLSNVHGQVSNSALYRAKVELKITENAEDSSKNKEEYVLTDLQLLCSKVVGFENSGLYIFGDKIYFASPSTVKNSDGKVMYSLLTFYSVDLNGQNFSEIYQTKEFSSGKYSMISINGNVYILLFDGDKIIRIDTNGTSKILAEEVTSVALPKSENVADNSYSATENEKFVYYTTENDKNSEEIDYGNILNKVNIVSGDKTELYKENYITVTLTKFENDKIYYQRNITIVDMSTTTDTYLFENDLKGSIFKANEKQLSLQSSITDMIEFKESDMDGYVYVSNSKLYYRSADGTTFEQLSSSASKVLFVKGKYVYYVSSSAFYRVDATKDSPSGEKLSDSNTINTTYFDIDNNLAYFFVKDSKTSVYYTYYVDLVNFKSGETKPVKAVA